MHRFILRVGLLAMVLSFGLVQRSVAKSISWTGNANLNWDMASVDWTNGAGPQVYADGDDVSFEQGLPHYATYNIAITAGGVTPNSIVIKPKSEGIHWRFSGGDIKGATSISVNPGYSPDFWGTTYVHFDGYTNSLSFSGGLNIAGGRTVTFKPTLMGGVYGLGSGAITLQKASTFHFFPTATNCTLTNTIIVASGYTNTANFDFENAPTFSGNFNLDGDLYIETVGGGYDTCIFNGDFILSSNRTIYGGNRDIAAGFDLETVNGLFTGNTHTLTLDFKGASGGANIGIRVNNTNAFRVANLIVTNVYSLFTSTYGGLVMNQADGSNNFFRGIRDNGGKVNISGGRITARRGGLDCPLLQGDTNSLLYIAQDNAAYDVSLLNSPLLVNATGGVARVKVYQGTGALGALRGHVTVGTGGVYTLEGQYNSACELYGGDLTLLGGGTVDVTGWGLGGMGFLNHWYEFQDSTQKLWLGDGNPATLETITLRGIEQTTGANASNGVFFMSIASSNVVDDGGTILRYEALNGIGVVNYGWTGLKSVQGYSSGTVDYQFRGGSAGTVFAPTSTNQVGAVGMTTGTVFTVTNLIRHVTGGVVGFYNSTTTGHPNGTGHRGNAGDVLISSTSGVFNLEATGIVQAASIIVTNGGTIGGIGTFAPTNNVRVYDGTIKPGWPLGTLTVSNLVLNSNSMLVYDLTSTDPSNEMIHVTGNLTLDGTVTVANRAVGPVPGVTYTLMTFDGTLTDNGLAKVSLPGAISIVGNEVRISVPFRGSVFVVH